MVLILLLIIAAILTYYAIRSVSNAPLEESRREGNLDADAHTIPCPPEHGPHCTCTWKD